MAGDSGSVEQRRISLPTQALTLAYVPAGVCVIGTSDEEYARIARLDPRIDPVKMRRGMPQHIAVLDSFWIGVTMVTAAQFADFCRATGREHPPTSSPGTVPPDYPVMEVSWYDAAAFCDWLSSIAPAFRFRLPTEAEREKTARGIDSRVFPWGDDWIESAAWTDYDDPSFPGTPAPVGTHPIDRGPYGCFDMIGNGYEWCLDYYDQDYYKVAPPSNPRGPDTGRVKSLRSCGGGIGRPDRAIGYNYLAGLRCASRGCATPHNAYENVGFRVAAEER